MLRMDNLTLPILLGKSDILGAVDLLLHFDWTKPHPR